MKRFSLLLFTIIALGHQATQAQQTRQKLKDIVVNHFFSCTLNQMLDTLASTYQIRIVYDKNQLASMDVVEHFFEEPLKSVIAKVCDENDLKYWIESSGTIFILKNTDDLARLKKLNQLALQAANAKIKRHKTENDELETKLVPKHFMFSINGRVIDQLTGESLPSASVKIRNTDLNAVTNAEGYFTFLRVPSDTCIVEVSYAGYQQDFFRLSPDKINNTLVCGLYSSLNTLNEVSITGKKSGVMNTDSRQVGVLQLSPANLDKLPTMGDKDILRAFQLMPGVSGTNESSSGAYVRGGTPDQNLVLLDGFTIYQVDHLYGFFSAFNASAVKDVQLYKGGFTSKYGGRLSSVTEINGKEGNKNETNMGVDLSLLSASGFLETPLSDKSTLLLAIRRSYQGPFYNKIFNQFNQTTTFQGGSGGGGGGGFGGRGGGEFANQVTPSSYFYDANVKYTYTISQKDKVSVSYYSGTDKTDNSRDLGLPPGLSGSSSGIGITDYTKYGNLGSSIKWFRQWSKKLYSNNYITYSSYFNDRTRGSSGGSLLDSNGIAHTFSNNTIEDNNLKDVGYKSEWELQISNNYKLLFGGFVNYKKIDYEYTQNDTTKLINQHNNAVLEGVYAELSIDPSNNFHIQPGLRASYYGPTGKPYFEPRLSASYNINDRFTVKGATGQFYQFENQVIREDILAGDRNFWVLSNNSNIPVGMARHYIGGLSYETDELLISVEGYYKTLTGLTQYTVRQTQTGGGGGFFRQATPQTTTVTEDFYQGTGRDAGVELLLQKKLGNYTGWVSYTLAKAENKFSVFGTDYYPANQDVRHEFKSINMYHYDRFNFAATFLFSTGRPYTAPLSTYTIKTADGNSTTYLNISDKNGERLPAYQRLDMSVSYDLLKIDGRKVGSIGLSFFNVYNHTNTWYREYQMQNNQVITTNVNYLGFTPNLTLSLRWK